MTLWLDAQLPWTICQWIEHLCGVQTRHVRGTQLWRADDRPIFESLRHDGAVLLTKDQDFADLVLAQGPPPQIVWLRIGNITNRVLRASLHKSLPQALELIRAGEPLVEILPVTSPRGHA